jgi:RNA ligase (TIGR02306 family)
MSQFAVQIVRVLDVINHPNADRLDIATIHGYTCIVQRDTYAKGDLIAYIPEAAVVPQWLLQALNLEGKLAGSKHDRVKAMRLRGVFSQGLVYGAPGQKESWSANNDTEKTEFEEGADIKEWLGITKYEPPVPTALQGEVCNAGQHLTVAFDIEDIKRHPTVLQDGEEVVMTEKLHGTFTGVGVVPAKNLRDDFVNGRVVVFSKGLGADGLVMKDNEANINNAYMKMAKETGLAKQLLANFPNEDEPVFILGETFGRVQDLEYGVSGLAFRAFAMVRGYRGNQRYVDNDEFEATLNSLGVQRVPVLYRGPFSNEALKTYTNGKETVSGKGAHIREGVVVVPVVERRDMTLGRVCLKSVSEDYKTRGEKNATEFN